jgi:hypothetical protein
MMKAQAVAEKIRLALSQVYRLTLPTECKRPTTPYCNDLRDRLI